MNEYDKVQIHQRVRALYRYTNAMEHGESEVVASVLEEARQDSSLERMVLELNEVYHVEDSAIVHPNDIAQAHEMLLDVFSSSPDERIALAASLKTGEVSVKEPTQPVSLAPVRAQAISRATTLRSLALRICDEMSAHANVQRDIGDDADGVR